MRGASDICFRSVFVSRRFASPTMSQLSDSGSLSNRAGALGFQPAAHLGARRQAGSLEDRDAVFQDDEVGNALHPKPAGQFRMRFGIDF